MIATLFMLQRKTSAIGVIFLIFIIIASGCVSQEKSIDACKGISAEDVGRYICASEIVFEQRNIAICENFDTVAEKNLCYGEIANECSCLDSTPQSYPDVCSAIEAKGFTGACE